MTIGILDPFSGIAGDMTLAALIDCGLDPEWLIGLPGRLGLDGVGVRIGRVSRGELACVKVDFDIPTQPHGRHLRDIRAIVARSEAPPSVRARADAAFLAIAQVEGAMHGVPVERVHLHEVGAVDAILDIVGSVWGFAVLGVDAVYCGPIALGDGTVQAAHGVLPVPAPATLKLLEGHAVRPGPEGSGELVTPTGAALVRVLSSGAPPAMFVPRRSGFGAGTKDFRGRANALRLILADALPAGSALREPVVTLAADIDDMTSEYLAGAADRLRAAGALDATLTPVIMKKGRAGTRLEVLARPEDADRLEALVLGATTTLGVRRTALERRALPRHERTVVVLGHPVAVKVATLPDGTERAKPAFDDVQRAAEATARPAGDIFALAVEAVRPTRDPSGPAAPAGDRVGRDLPTGEGQHETGQAVANGPGDSTPAHDEDGTHEEPSPGHRQDHPPAPVRSQV